MDEHPGDTLGSRFLTFWGVLGSVAAIALLLGLFRWIAIPSDGDERDGGAAAARTRVLHETRRHAKTELTTVAEVEPGKTVRLPAESILPWAAATLSGWKAAPGPEKTPEAIVREQLEKAESTHDPDLSRFEEN